MCSILSPSFFLSLGNFTQYLFFRGVSPANSGTIESVYFDEVGPKKIFVQELTTPETWKLDLLIETKGLGEKVKEITIQNESKTCSMC
jgi:hypothetical protein